MANVKLIAIVALLCVCVSAGVVQAADSSEPATTPETTISSTIPILAPDQPVVYLVTAAQAQTYTKLNDKFVALAETLNKDTEIKVTATDGAYAQFEDGYILLTDITIKPDPSSVTATPTPVAVPPLEEPKDNGANVFILIFIFLIFLTGSGACGYMLRGRLDKKRWENDPFRFDPGMKPKTQKEPEQSQGTEDKEPPYPAYAYMDTDPTVAKPSIKEKKQKKPGLFAKKEKKSRSTKDTSGSVNPRYIKGGIDAANRPYYYEPEEIDPDGKPFWLENGEKRFYE